MAMARGLGLAFVLAWAGVSTATPQDLGDRLAAHYPLDGNGSDVSPFRQDAVSVGPVEYETGIDGLALHLRGDGAHLEVPSGPALDTVTDGATLSFWLKADPGGLIPSLILMKRMPWEGDQTLGDESIHFGVGLSGGGGLYFIWSRWQGRYPGYSAYYTNDLWATMNDGAWHLVTVTHRYDSNEEAAFYFDGEAVPVLRDEYGVGNGPAVVRSSKLWIGLQPTGGGPYRGSIDDVRVYGRRLGASEAAELYARRGFDVSAGPDQTVYEGSRVRLSAAASPSDGVSYLWEQIGGAPVVISDPMAPEITFEDEIAGGVAGDHTDTFMLTASRNGRVATDFVDVTVRNRNHAPVALPPADQVVNEGSVVVLDATASYDPDGDEVVCHWSPAVDTDLVLSNADSCRTTFVAPVLEGGYGAAQTLVFRVSASDGLLTGEGSMSVKVEQVNHAPVAVVGPNSTVNEQSELTLDGSASHDPDGDALTYEWRVISGAGVSLADPSSPRARMSAPAVDPGGATAVIELIVVDGGGLASLPARLEVRIVDLNDPPTCALGRASTGLLWPPNHKMIPVSIEGLTDPQGDHVAVVITGVTQDESVGGLGDGDTSPDAVLAGDEVLLRAERSGLGDGRLYRLRFTADDGRGGTCEGTAAVRVPRDPRSAPGDDAPRFDSVNP